MSLIAQTKFAYSVVIWDEEKDRPDTVLVAATTPSLVLAAWHQAREDFPDYMILCMKGEHIVEEPDKI